MNGTVGTFMLKMIDRNKYARIRHGCMIVWLYAGLPVGGSLPPTVSLLQENRKEENRKQENKKQENRKQESNDSHCKSAFC